MPETITEHLRMTATVTVRALDAQAREESADLALWPLAQRIAILDERVCELCEYLDGMIMRRDSPDFAQYGKPVHINDRCRIAYIGADEVEIDEHGRPVPMTPDFVAPPLELIRKHGHFIADPDRYAPLRIPAQPEGRDFVFKRVRDPRSGDLVSVIDWRTRMYEIPGLFPETIHIPALVPVE